MKVRVQVPEIQARIRYGKREAAETLCISVRQLERLMADGSLIGRRDGGRVFFDHDELVSYARSCAPCEAA